MEDVYVTRNSGNGRVQVWPADVGIRKFHGCVEYGAAWDKENANIFFGKRSYECSASFTLFWCKLLFGFRPKEGEAWLIEGKKRTKVGIDFSN